MCASELEHSAEYVAPWYGPNTSVTKVTWDDTKVRISCWEYSANGWDGPHTCPTMPTHAVAWMRPRFEQIDGYAACMSERWATPRPEVVTLCGSTRFKDAFIAETRRLTLQGIIVISVGLFGWDEGRPEDVLGEDVKAALDELHKHKIDLADRIHVIDVGGYVGSSTQSEIQYATTANKVITYMEPLALIDGQADG